MALSTQEQMLIEQRVTNEAKSVGLAYILLIFLGGLGIHRFYLGATGTGAAILVLFILGFLTLPIGLGFVLLLGVGIWLLVDLFMIPGMVQADKDALRLRLSGMITASDRKTP